jgi:hypothetical protein
MARRKKRRAFRDAPEIHRDKAHHAFSDSAHHAALARMAAQSGRCTAALSELVTAAGALEEGKAHVESGGQAGASRWASTARRAVSSAESAVGRGCFCKR